VFSASLRLAGSDYMCPFGILDAAPVTFFFHFKNSVISHARGKDGITGVRYSETVNQAMMVALTLSW
jgi:hypothetical protein